MNVLFITIYNPLYFGGINNHVRNLSKTLTAQGAQVHVAVSGLETKTVVVDKVQYHFISSGPKFTLGQGINFNLTSSPYIKKIVNEHKIDIVHGQSPSSFGYAVNKAQKTPFIVTLHGTSFGEILSYSNLSLNDLNFGVATDALVVQPLMALLTRIEYQRANMLITVSKAVAREIIAFNHVSPSKVYTIHNGIDLSEYGCNPAVKNTAFFSILVVARLIRRKGLNYLIEAIPKVMEQYPNTKLTIVGSYGDQEAALRKRVSDLSLQKSIEFYHNIPWSFMLNLLRQADVYVQPSLYEPFSIAILEAMCMGKAIVATNVGGNPELIAHEKEGLLVEPANVQQLAESISRLLSDSFLRERLGSNAIQKVKVKFTWETIGKQTLKLYTDVLNNF